MSLKSTAEFAQVDRTGGDTLLTSANLVEHRHAIPTDEISPDTLRAALDEQIQVLEQQLWSRMIAVDWGSLRTRIETFPGLEGPSFLVLKLDVL